MLIDLSYILLGFLLLTAGAELLVSGAAQLAARWGVRPMVIGLTIVALGTSAPEMAASLAASVLGSGDIAVGNVVGSNIGNIGLALGLATLIRPLTVHSRLIRIEVPFLIAISGLIYLVSFTGFIPRWLGLALLLGLCGYLLFLYRWSRNEGPECAAPYAGDDKKPQSLSANVLKVLLGLAGLVGGGHLLVEGAVGLARWAGISELVIGLTVVAIGTSLPEVVTSLVAVWRGQVDIAIGNVLGSNLFNILAVLGGAALIRPITVQKVLVVRDLPVMGLMTLLLFPILRSGFVLRRWEGIVFLTIYIAYIGALAIGYG
ncbi:MAG: calcium/sodium antiporter [Nitrospiria bacterium]